MEQFRAAYFEVILPALKALPWRKILAYLGPTLLFAPAYAIVFHGTAWQSIWLSLLVVVAWKQGWIHSMFR